MSVLLTLAVSSGGNGSNSHKKKAKLELKVVDSSATGRGLDGFNKTIEAPKSALMCKIQQKRVHSLSKV